MLISIVVKEFEDPIINRLCELGYKLAGAEPLNSEQTRQTIKLEGEVVFVIDRSVVSFYRGSLSEAWKWAKFTCLMTSEAALYADLKKMSFSKVRCSPAIAEMRNRFLLHEIVCLNESKNNN